MGGRPGGLRRVTPCMCSDVMNVLGDQVQVSGHHQEEETSAAPERPEVRVRLGRWGRHVSRLQPDVSCAWCKGRCGWRVENQG